MTLAVSMTFQAWKMVLLNSMTSQEEWSPCLRISLLKLCYQTHAFVSASIISHDGWFSSVSRSTSHNTFCLGTCITEMPQRQWCPCLNSLWADEESLTSNNWFPRWQLEQHPVNKKIFVVWLCSRKGNRPVKLSGEELAWLSVWSEVQMICIWSSWCHCHPIISCSSKIQNGLPFWCQLTHAVLEKGH